MSYVPTNAGVYTPTLTNVQNVISSTAYQCQWVMVRNIVTVSGQLDIDPDLASTSTRVGISLPLATSLSDENLCAGVASSPNVATLVASILGDVTNSRALIQYETTDTSNRAFYFTFTYLIS